MRRVVSGGRRPGSEHVLVLLERYLVTTRGRWCIRRLGSVVVLRIRFMLRNRSPVGANIRTSLLVLNAVGATVSAAFAARGVLRPEYVQPTQTGSSLTSFWAASSAVRSWAITVPLVGSLGVAGRAAPQLLVVAGLAQLGDGALGIWQRRPDMTVAPAAMGLVHLASARLLSR